MQIIVIGDTVLFQELAEKAGSEHQLTRLDNAGDYSGDGPVDMVIDFTIEESVDNLFSLFDHIQADLYVLNTVKTSLHELAYLTDGLDANVIGFNGLPGFIGMDTWEVTSLQKEIPDTFPFSYIRVDDRVGMVTPRVICMIINEAYYTVQEGTASREDIDLGMKLGTGYPYGPFEWVEKIGVHHVYELLESLYRDTQEERYKICALLRKEYLLS